SRVVRVEVGTARENFVKNEVTRCVSIFVQEVDSVVLLGSDLRHERQRGLAQLVFHAWLGAYVGNDGVSVVRNVGIANAGFVCLFLVGSAAAEKRREEHRGDGAIHRPITFCRAARAPSKTRFTGPSACTNSSCSPSQPLQ